MGRPLLSNQTEDDHIPHHADISFYFTVVKPETVLADYDLTPPTCSLVCMDNCTVGDCQGGRQRCACTMGAQDWARAGFFGQETKTKKTWLRSKEREAGHRGPTKPAF